MEKIKDFILKNRKGDKTIWIIFFILVAWSIVELFSASSTLAFRARNPIQPILRHITFLAVGIGVAYIIHLIPTKLFRSLSFWAVLGSMVLLLLVLIVGTRTNEAKRWISILGIAFQPSDIAKTALVIYSAKLIDKIRKEPQQENFYFTILMLFSSVILVFILLENFSTAFILGATVFAMLFLGKIHWKKLIGIIATILFLGILVGTYVTVVPREKSPQIIAKVFHRPYTWKARIEDKANEQGGEKRYEINDDNRQVQNGRIAIARGGLFGVLPGNSIQRDYLPHAYDDCIYSIIIEETGLFGGAIIMLIFLTLLFRTGAIAYKSKSTFNALLITGLGILISLQAFVNMVVGSGFGLITGQPLPLISRGGTSILMTCVNIGIILSVAREIKKQEKENNETFAPQVEVENEQVIDIQDID